MPAAFTEGAARQDRALGCLLGLAVGDALGTTLEFARRDSRPAVTDMVGGGPFGLPPGAWTDDTSMALCLAESLLAHGRVDPHDLMTRFVRWYRDGHNSVTGTCFDIGGATRAALERFLRTGDPLAGSTDPRSAGNGSIMRLAPVPLAYARRHWTDRFKICEFADPMEPLDQAVFVLRKLRDGETADDADDADDAADAAAVAAPGGGQLRTKVAGFVRGLPGGAKLIDAVHKLGNERR